MQFLPTMKQIALLATLAFAASQFRLSECGKSKKEGKVVHISERTSPTYICPDNYEQRSTGHENICLMTVEAPPIETCFQGQLQNGLCVSYDHIIQACPVDYHPTTAKKMKKATYPLICARVSVVSPQPRCMNGDFQAGQCITERIASVLKVCPTVTGKHTSGCYDWVSVPKVLKCKPGFDLQGSMCVGEEMQPCPVEYNVCSGGGECSNKLRKKEKSKKRVPHKASICEVHTQTRPFEVCPPDSHENLKASGCLALREIELQPFCPMQNGIIDEDGLQCRSIFREEPIYNCPGGFTPCDKQPLHGSAKCCRIDYAEPIISCRNGAEESGGKCVASTPPEFICEEGLTLDGDICKGFDVVMPKLRYSITVETAGKHKIMAKKK